jgi:hypothetical protein
MPSEGLQEAIQVAIPRAFAFDPLPSKNAHAAKVLRIVVEMHEDC